MTPDGFRPGEDLNPAERLAIEAARAAAKPQAPTLAFTPAASAGGTDLDVLLGYQIFLGRDPENSFVIADAKSSPIGAFIRAMLGSGEFQSAVLDRLDSGRPLPHEAAAIAPSRQQLDWLFRFLAIPDFAVTMLRSAPTWRDWFRVFLAIPGVPVPPRRDAPPKEAAPLQDAGEADQGFVLIHLEQPRAGDKLQPGMLVNGAGWTIAPADIADIAILLDDRLLTHARTGLPRPDVARNFPHYRNVDHCGFTFAADIPLGVALTPSSILAIRVRTARGDEGLKTLRVQLPEQKTLAESRAPADGWPIRLSIEEAFVDETRMLRVRGWALARAGLAALGAELNGVPLPQPSTGLPRPDIAKIHADYRDAPISGFALATELPAGVPAGPSFVRIAARDSGGVSRHASLPVTIPAADGAGQGASPDAQGIATGGAGGLAALADSHGDIRWQLDTPVLIGTRARDTVSGVFTVAGWAVARTGLQSVMVLLNGKILGEAHLGMRREDIGAAFPDYPGSLLSGFALVLPPGAVPPGRHWITVRVTAKPEGQEPAATLDEAFELDVAAHDALPPQGALRARLALAEAEAARARLAASGAAPRFDLLIPLPPDATPDTLIPTLRSLHEQAYPTWRATILANPAQTVAMRASPASPWMADEAGRIRIGVRRATQERGKPKEIAAFLMKLAPGDTLGADALLDFALSIAANPAADFLYADDQREDRAQPRRQAFFKPDWSPNFLLSTNYIGRAFICAEALAQRAGFDPASLAASSDYDAVLRLTEHAASIHHVPRVLFALNGAADSESMERAALAAAIQRRGLKAVPEPGLTPGIWRTRFARPESKAAPLVSIIMPTCSAGNLVRAAIKSIRATTAPLVKTGVTTEIVVVDNTPARSKAAKTWLAKNADTVVSMPDPFNWSRFNNAGAKAARGDYLLFLNDDIEAKSPGWLEALLEHAQRDGVGIVGAKLLYPDGTIQHAGQYLADFHARHAFRFADGKAPGPFGMATAVREVSAVTGACQMMHRRVFDQLQGFEEAHGVINNDLDVCLRAQEAGLAVLITPHAELVHHELASRATLADTYDEARFVTSWRRRFALGDPFRNPNLARDSDHYAPEPEPAEILHAGRRAPAPETIARILVLKLDHIGDFLTAQPALARLAALFPNASVDLLVPSASAALAASGGKITPGLAARDVLVFDFFHSRSGQGKRDLTQGEFEALEARLLPKAYDLAIDLRMHADTREVLRHTGARLLAGYDHQNRYPWLDIALEWEGDIALVRKRAHVSERLQQLVSAVADAGISPPPARFAPVAPASVPALAALPKGFLRKKLVCVHPGVGNVVRQWPAAHYAALIDLLTGEAGVHAVLIGAAEEAPIADDIMRRIADPSRVESLVGRIKLAELPSVMRGCSLFIGNNSGPQHMAASLGLPTIGIHSGVVDAAEWAPLGAQAIAMRRRMMCSPCYLEFVSDCPRDLACLRGLLPRDVFAAAQSFLQAG
jgi:ADP-heptose:LPS heptosyltransferase/GT2 family glycosyltransferase